MKLPLYAADFSELVLRHWANFPLFDNKRPPLYILLIEVLSAASLCWRLNPDVSAPFVTNGEVEDGRGLCCVHQLCRR